MWRLCRKTIFPRWHAKRQNQSENKNENATCPKFLALLPSSEKKGYSDNYSKRQNSNKRSEKFCRDSHFYLNFFSSSILETAGWLGAAALVCLNLHRKHIKTIYDHDRKISSCIFSRSVYTMPHSDEKKENSSSSILNISDFKKSTVAKVCSNIESLEDWRKLTAQYEAAVENSTGVAYINRNDKKAFHCFQAAARMGSSQGFYNLGLCYELGRGTRVNLSRAAFCYKKAVEKGHGLAAFNLAVYFLKGIGGLPVDIKAAKLLLAEAAAQNVPEAQTYIGLEYLENAKFSDAFTMFKNLSESNISDGKYYLGLCYENGWGVDKSERIATELFSQAARAGNHKATLQLGKYYEEGRGGCDTDYDFAAALYQTLTKEGNDEAQKALLKLKLRQKMSLKEFHKKEIEKNNMHVSASVPELASSKSFADKAHSQTSIISYLDLTIPFFPLKINHNYQINKTSFYIGDIQISNKTCMPFYHSNLPKLMAAET